MELLLYLILAHFIADYPLQPGWLVAYKKRSLWGVLIHTSVHLTVTILILFPYWHLQTMWWATITIFMTHTFIDYSKVKLEGESPQYRFLWYVLDQIAHLMVIIGVHFVWLINAAPRISGNLAHYYLDVSLISFVLILVLSTFVYDVSRWVFLTREKMHPYKRDWVMIIKNSLIIMVAFVAYWVMG